MDGLSLKGDFFRRKKYTLTFYAVIEFYGNAHGEVRVVDAIPDEDGLEDWIDKFGDPKKSYGLFPVGF